MALWSCGGLVGEPHATGNHQSAEHFLPCGKCRAALLHGRSPVPGTPQTESKPNQLQDKTSSLVSVLEGAGCAHAASRREAARGAVGPALRGYRRAPRGPPAPLRPPPRGPRPRPRSPRPVSPGVTARPRAASRDGLEGGGGGGGPLRPPDPPAGPSTPPHLALLHLLRPPPLPPPLPPPPPPEEATPERAELPADRPTRGDRKRRPAAAGSNRRGFKTPELLLGEGPLALDMARGGQGDGTRPGAEALARAAQDHGAEVVFANPGTTEMHLVGALDAPGLRLRPVLGLPETVSRRTPPRGSRGRAEDRRAARRALDRVPDHRPLLRPVLDTPLRRLQRRVGGVRGHQHL